MSLDDWARNGWLQKPQTSPNEIRDLLDVVRDMVDSAPDGLGANWRGTYNTTPDCGGGRILGYRLSADQYPIACGTDHGRAPAAFL